MRENVDEFLALGDAPDIKKAVDMSAAHIVRNAFTITSKTTQAHTHKRMQTLTTLTVHVTAAPHAPCSRAQLGSRARQQALVSQACGAYSLTCMRIAPPPCPRTVWRQ